eukprot:Gb_16472 [translate_table: standard]
MEGCTSSKRIRQHFEMVEESDSDADETPRQKKPRFPKGKKEKLVADIRKEHGNEEGPIKATDPRLAAKQRATRRSRMAEELVNARDTSVLDDIGAAEEEYENGEDLEDDGIKIEPFNLKQEREEGYFDSEGNYVEYGNENEIKDAWLESVEVDTRFAEEHLAQPIQEKEDDPNLSSQEIAKIKRNIANLLQPGETVLDALRRMKGTPSEKKRREKMSAETKTMFDQLTDDAMQLLENGDFNVYHEKRETFQREVEGYERLARARSATSVSNRDLHRANEDTSPNETEDIFADDEVETRKNYDLPSAPASVTLNADLHSLEASSSGGFTGTIDIFGEDDADVAATTNMPSVGQDTNCDPTFQEALPGSANIMDDFGLSGNNVGGGVSDVDYVYDESSGYYYNSKLGYYYDPSTGLFCSAASGKWYRFNEQSNIYEEMQNESTEITNS